MTDTTPAPIGADAALVQALEKLLANFESQHALLLKLGAPDFVAMRDQARAALSTAAQPPHSASQGDALIDFIESVGSVHIHRVRAGFNGPMRWDVEYGYEDAKVSGRTLRDALSGAIKTARGIKPAKEQANG